MQTKYQTWYCATVDFECSLDEVWTGSMAYTCPEFNKDSCTIEKQENYTMYSLDYDKNPFNAYFAMCGFCRVPTCYPTTFCNEC